MFRRNEITDPFVKPVRERFPWWKLEEYLPDGGMWGIVPPNQRDQVMDDAEALMLDIPAFMESMSRALQEWPKSCAVAMTTPGLNKRAWLGHAGSYLATGCTEDLTKSAWHRLNTEQKRVANEAADTVISLWHTEHAKPQTQGDN